MKKLHDIVVFSDFHAHPFPYAAKLGRHDRLAGLYNTRLIDAAKVLREIRTYCDVRHIKHVLFGGDLFHVRSSVKTKAMHMIQWELAHLAEVAEVNMISGNHDYADRHGSVSALELLRHIDNVQIIDKHDKVEVLDDTFVYPVPYTDDPTIAKDGLKRAGLAASKTDAKFKILLAHLGMQGATVGSDYVMLSQSDIKVPDVPYKAFTMCLFGHYHEHQKLFPNGYFIGATHHHNWGDANTQRGFLHLELWEDGSITFKRIETAAPKFLKLDKTTASQARPKDFVKYFRQGNDPVPINAKQLEVIDVDETEDDIKFDVDSLDPETILKEWVAIHDKDDYTCEVGLGLLAEAKGK